MVTTSVMYATTADGQGLSGQPSAWANVTAATGAPQISTNDADYARNNNSLSPGYQRILLTGYAPQATLLAENGGEQPYSIDNLHLTVYYRLDNAANYDSINVLLLDSTTGSLFAYQPLTRTDGGALAADSLNFPTAGLGFGARPWEWADLADLEVSIEVNRSETAGADTFKLDAVSLDIDYSPTAPAPDPEWTIVATAEPDNYPPRVRVDVTTATDTTEATILRINPDGSTSRLRTTSGDVLQLPGGEGILYDYEMPLGQSVTYTVAGVP